jgi:hypothetical protein
VCGRLRESGSGRLTWRPRLGHHGSRPSMESRCVVSVGGGGSVDWGREGGVGWRGRARTVAEPCGEAVDAHDIGL